MLGKEFIFYGIVSMSDTNTYVEYGGLRTYVHFALLIYHTIGSQTCIAMQHDPCALRASAGSLLPTRPPVALRTLKREDGASNLNRRQSPRRFSSSAPLFGTHRWLVPYYVIQATEQIRTGNLQACGTSA